MRLRLGIRRYLICFSPLAFESQRQLFPSNLPSPLVFLLISTHFTAPPKVPVAPKKFNPGDILPNTPIESRSLKKDLSGRLHVSLRPMLPDNARRLRITETSGT
jgi:hypothetical protein